MTESEIQKQLARFREEMREMCRASDCGDEYTYNAHKIERDAAEQRIQHAFRAMSKQVAEMVSEAVRIAAGIRAPENMNGTVWIGPGETACDALDAMVTDYSVEPNEMVKAVSNA